MENCKKTYEKEIQEKELEIERLRQIIVKERKGWWEKLFKK